MQADAATVNHRGAINGTHQDAGIAPWVHLLEQCRLCPRNCGVNRLIDQKGYCKTGHDIVIARADLHFWEEPCISGERGSGTIFFSRCNLSCAFCQNYQISQLGRGRQIPPDRLVDIFFELESRGAHNINLVTPTHYVPQIIGCIAMARQRGLALPIVYNTNSYENPETIDALAGHIQVYLPDLKYYDDRLAERYSNAPGYFRHATAAIELMYRQTGPPRFDDAGMMTGGVLIRHLVLPGHVADTKKILSYIHAIFGEGVHISLMNQYTPQYRAIEQNILPHPLSDEEYDEAVQYALELGIEHCFVQEGGTAEERFIPPFEMD